MILNVAKISASNAEILKGMTYNNGTFFSPVQDGNGNWIITLQESQYLDRSEFYFSVITWNPPIIDLEL